MRRARSGGRLRVGLSLVVACSVAAGLLVLQAASDARQDLRAAQQQLQVARRMFGDGDAHEAGAALRRAATASERADTTLHGVAARAAAAVPLIGNSLDVATALARSSHEITNAALQVVATIEGLPGGMDALTPTSGRLPVDALETLSGPLEELAKQMDLAVARVDDTPHRFLIGEAERAREEFAALASDMQALVDTGAAMASEMPGFLGAEGPRRYFVAVANPAELRATGGFLGAYAIMTIDDGAVDIGSFGPTWDLPSLEAGRVAPPDPSFAARYDEHNATGAWANINMSPDFPTVATAIERLWAATSDQSVDGTLLVDPFTLESLVRLTGPVTLPETGAVLRPGTVVDYVTNESFADLEDPRERKEAIGDVASASLEAFLAGSAAVPVQRVARTLGDLAQERHLMLHAADADEQWALEAIGVAGRLSDPRAGTFLRVSYNSATGSKVDYWLDEEIVQHVRLLDDGAAEVTVTVRLRNDAPTTGVKRVVGPNRPDVDAGDNMLLVSVYCGSRCRFLSGDGGSDEVGVQEELGQMVASTWVTIPSSERAELTFTQVTEGAWWTEDGVLATSVLHQDQTMVRDGQFEYVLALPDGFVPASVPEGATIEGDDLRWRREGRADVRLNVTLRPRGRKAGLGSR